jgi:signal transduction histidine kinase
VAFRRSQPIVTVVVVTAVQVATELADVAGTGWIGVLIAVYSLGAHGSGRPRTVAAVACAAAVAVLLTAGVATDAIGLDAWISTTVVVIGAFVLGDNLQKRRDHLASLAERAERAERERELLARERVGEERSRIARELHDVVAHSVSVMVIQAGAARRQLAHDPERAATALATIEDTGRRAMDELRRVLGLMRQDHARAADGVAIVPEPQPSLDSLTALVASDPTLDVTLSVQPDLGPIPQSVELNVYRVVQESLTNVRRHAGRVDHVAVSVVREAGCVIVEVVDDGRGAGADPAPEGGFGLIGMRERVDLLGGQLEVGPRRGGGWRVRASLPTGST